MIPLQDVLPDLSRHELPTRRERNLEFELEQLRARIQKLEQWRDRYE